MTSAELIAKIKEVSDLIRGIVEQNTKFKYSNGNLSKIIITGKKADGKQVIVTIDFKYDAEGNLIEIDKKIQI